MDKEELDKEQISTEEPIDSFVEENFKSRKAFRKLGIELTSEELASPGVQKLLLEEIERLGKKESNLEILQKELFGISKENAVLKEKGKAANAQEFLYTAMITISSLIIGLSKNLWDSASGMIVLSLGLLLLLSGWFFKFYRK